MLAIAFLTEVYGGSTSFAFPTLLPSSFCLSTFMFMMMPRAKKLVNPWWMTLKRWCGMVEERVKTVLFGWSLRMRL
ncbi:hypothetical protein MUK42_10766 [Musa troglodytarum]|uniref:Uncharacterized protein n=1 Tax=Musa troglodytarum TaxID=320322 RepID=A0A9E7KNX0_9LILI|nr:hypothetical protein MUK42_10766 [Musa troglodytarum]